MPSTNGNNGRDAGGRFGKGNPGGPGNPFARRVAELRRVLLSTVTEDDIRAVTRRLVELTLAGDMAAARVLLAYAIGKPVEVVDPDTLDLQEWALLRQTPVNSDDMLRALTGMPLDVACLIVRTALPQIAAGTARLAQEKLRADPAEHGGKKSGAKPARKSAGKAQRKRR